MSVTTTPGPVSAGPAIPVGPESGSQAGAEAEAGLGPLDPIRSGRPMDSSRDSAILSAALELVAEVGYERVTMDAIAARCHASKATMYRRWSSKAALVADAMKERKQCAPFLPDTGEVRKDLLDGLRETVAATGEIDFDICGGLLTASRTDPELAELIREQMVTDKRAASRTWTQRAIDRGDLPAGTDLNLVFEIAPAVIFTRLLITGEPVDEAFLVHLVDDVLIPLLTYVPDSQNAMPLIPLRELNETDI